MIRRATIFDLDAVVELAREAVSIDPIPVKEDRRAMRDTARQCLQPAHFLMVSEIDGEVVGAVAAMVQPSFWYRGLQCSVLLHYSRVPGQWAWLMKAFAKWAKGRSGIKATVIELEPHHGEKMQRFLAHIGFNRQSMNMGFVRGLE